MYQGILIRKWSCVGLVDAAKNMMYKLHAFINGLQGIFVFDIRPRVNAWLPVFH